MERYKMNIQRLYRQVRIKKLAKENKERYEKRMTGGKEKIREQDRIDKFKQTMFMNNVVVDWLAEKGFFTAPASTKYHGAYEGGLFDHSLVVMKELEKLTQDNGLVWGLSRSPGIIGMFHDLCKTDAYIKNEDGTYGYNENLLLPGHGEKSIILLQKWFDLTEEEILCIRWHMGAFDDKENWKYYSKSVAKYPNVLWVHQADMIASQVEGK